MFQSAPWADALFAVDPPWWEIYGAQVLATFTGLRFSGQVQHGLAKGSPFETFKNSGAAAIALAAWMSARRIVLVGYDCQRTGGKTHSHGDHPRGLGNAVSMPKWFERFEQCAKRMRGLGVEVINASRATALTCFPRGTLEDQLEQAATE